MSNLSEIRIKITGPVTLERDKEKRVSHLLHGELVGKMLVVRRRAKEASTKTTRSRREKGATFRKWKETSSPKGKKEAGFTGLKERIRSKTREDRASSCSCQRKKKKKREGAVSLGDQKVFGTALKN